MNVEIYPVLSITVSKRKCLFKIAFVPFKCGGITSNNIIPLLVFVSKLMNKPNYLSRLLLVSVLLMLAFFTMTASGCRVLKRDKASMAEKKKEAADKKGVAEYDKALKQHYKHQSKEAKKMMKRTRKQSAKYNKPLKRRVFSSTKCK